MNENPNEKNTYEVFNPSTMKYCKTCGKVIAKKAKVCPNCGAKNKKPIFKRVSTYIILLIVLIVLGYFVSAVKARVNLTRLSEDAYTMSEADYKAACTTMSYKDLARNADNIKGTKVAFTGEVFQVIFEGDNIDSDYFIAVTPDEYGLYFDNVYVLYNFGNGSKLLEDDIVTFYGEVTGSYTYTSTSGATLTVPAVKAAYVDIVQ